ncbi:polyprenyl synthetase family protein [Amycolatopsis minnesotensis]|uniref:Polyprenyl synthetase family protein n=1 Tax=Amycolatopsis minnesotensis TaxID=337894 RepID=A0ABP5E743_9PSEU
MTAIQDVIGAPAVDDLRRAMSERWRGNGHRVDEIARYALLSPGKLLRPLLLVTATEAVGGSRERVLPAALAVEYLHVASLIHDDIIDGDDLRRGRPAVHAAFGTPDAIVTGDALMFTVFSAVAECASLGVPESAVLEAVRVLARAGEDLCRGQVQEAMLDTEALAAGADHCLDAYLEMAALKTGALFRGACRAGALLGGGGPAEVSAITGFAEHAGLAFQMHDDLLPFLADSAVTGKPGSSDAANLRLTFPVLLAHREGARVDRVLRGAAPPGETFAALREAVTATGAVELARARAVEEAELAVAELGALPRTEAAALLGVIAEVAVRRDR